MSRRQGEVDEICSALAAQLTAVLHQDGWRVRELGFPRATIYTHDEGDGLIATAAVERARWHELPENAPVNVDVLLGVGYEPATALKPLLTVRAAPELGSAGRHGR